jgi:hypothetical protein
MLSMYPLVFVAAFHFLHWCPFEGEAKFLDAQMGKEAIDPGTAVLGGPCDHGEAAVVL